MFRLVGPKSTPLLCIQGPAIAERRGGRSINPIIGSTIANRVDRSTCREPLAFERNTGYILSQLTQTLGEKIHLTFSKLLSQLATGAVAQCTPQALVLALASAANYRALRWIPLQGSEG